MSLSRRSRTFPWLSAGSVVVQGMTSPVAETTHENRPAPHSEGVVAVEAVVGAGAAPLVVQLDVEQRPAAAGRTRRPARSCRGVGSRSAVFAGPALGGHQVEAPRVGAAGEHGRRAMSASRSALSRVIVVPATTSGTPSSLRARIARMAASKLPALPRKSSW